MKKNLLFNKDVEGTAYIMFSVRDDSIAEDFKILRGISDEVDQEIIAVLSGLQNWEIRCGRIVTIQYEMRMPVKLRKGKVFFKDK